MASPKLRPKLRVIFHTDGKRVQSYFYLEKTEASRVIKILKILPELKEWTSVSDVGEMISSKTPATLSVVLKLAGALRIDVKLSDRSRKILAKRPVLALKKEPHYIGNISGKRMYLRSKVFIKSIV